MKTLLLSLLALTLCAGPSAGQDSPALQTPQDDVPTVQEANDLLAAGDPLAAAEAYRKIAKAQPDNGQAHHMVGYCLHMAGKLEEALQAHLAAAEFPDVRGVALYNCACVHALKGRKDAAFEFLAKAREAGFASAQQLVLDSDMDNLRADPRFVKLLAELSGEGPAAVDLTQVPPARQFEFWVGTWQTALGDQVYGTASVTRTFGGRGLQQIAYTLEGNMRSTSHYFFNAQTGRWKQIWMDGEGSHSVLEGGLDGDRMVMTMVSVDGQPQVSGRSVFSNVTADGFDYAWQTSADGGQTWLDGTTVRFRKASN